MPAKFSILERIFREMIILWHDEDVKWDPLTLHLAFKVCYHRNIEFRCWGAPPSLTSSQTTDIWCWNLQAWLMIVLWRENCVNDENLRVYCFSISLLHSARKMTDGCNRLSQNLNLKILAENRLPSAPSSCSGDYKKIVWGVRSVTNWWQSDTVWHSVTQDHVTLCHTGSCHTVTCWHSSRGVRSVSSASAAIYLGIKG